MEELNKVKTADVEWEALANRAAIRGRFDIGGQRYECEMAFDDMMKMPIEDAKRQAILMAKPIWDDYPYAYMTIQPGDVTTTIQYDGSVSSFLASNSSTSY